MGKWGKLRRFCVFLFLPVLLLVSCGIEVYPFLEPIPQSWVSREFHDTATVLVGGRNAGDPAFQNFIIFYRIYISDLNTFAPLDNLSAINPTLASDFNAIRPHIDSTTLTTVNLDNLFRGRRHFYLDLRNENINNVLRHYGDPIYSLEFDFSVSTGRPPRMLVTRASQRAGGTYSEHVLFRSTDHNRFSPQPNRYFQNHPDLYASASATEILNADVADRTGIPAGPRYTYAALYIAALGLNIATYTNVYSTPTLIHVFQLP